LAQLRAEIALPANTGKGFGTVETVWGRQTIGVGDGALLALNYVGPPGTSAAMAPNYGHPERLAIIGLGPHFDMNVLVGALALNGRKPPAHQSLYELLAFVDQEGLHKIGTATRPRWETVDLDIYNAFRVWSRANRFPSLPSDGTPVDATSHMEAATTAFNTATARDAVMIESGRRLVADEARLNGESYVRTYGRTILRRSPEFVNGLYAEPGGTPRDACVAINPDKGTVMITVPFPIARRYPNISCASLATQLWGSRATGREDVANSPQGQLLNESHAEQAAVELDRQLQMASGVTPTSAGAPTTAGA
jgi:hypothetical protein